MSNASEVVTRPDSSSSKPCLRAQSPTSEDSLGHMGLPGPQIEDHSSTQIPPSGLGPRNAGPRKTTSEPSLSRTMEQLPSPSASSSSSSSESHIVGAIEQCLDPPTRNATCRSIRKRPHLSDLQQHASASRIPNEKYPSQSPNVLLAPPPKRRCVSADAATRARLRFTSPDRYVPQRPDLLQERHPQRTSKPPAMLRGREKYTRSRDTTQNPFRSISDRSAEMARRRQDNPWGLHYPHYTPSFVNGTDAAPFAVNPRVGTPARQLSWGGFWTVGGRAAVQLSQLHAIEAGYGMLASGTNAPIHTPTFLDHPTRDAQIKAHESRLALAMDIDQASRILQYSSPNGLEAQTPQTSATGLKWQNNTWTRERLPNNPGRETSRSGRIQKTIPTVAFRVLDAPHLKDDYYCSILAYSYTSRTLAVALTHKVYLWTEEYGVRYPPLPQARATNFVTSLAFSSDEGGKSILAVARHSGGVTLWSLLEPRPRFEAPHPAPASCVAFRPTVSSRQAFNSDEIVQCEDLLVGDDAGRIYYYSLEWPAKDPGALLLLVKLDAHNQNICGLAWAPDGETFASGGNDNTALLFRVTNILGRQTQHDNGTAEADEAEVPASPVVSGPGNDPTFGLQTPPQSPERQYIPGTHPMITTSELPSRAARRHGLESPPATPTSRDRPTRSPMRGTSAARSSPRNPSNARQRSARILNSDLVSPGIMGQMNMHTCSFTHSAAVKAMAFAPWQPSLLATGGGSNDRQIHFHHTGSGATLAVINVFAQVTSLIWSTTRRELVATFGYAQPEHEVRIAVFSWPSCECVVSIPWERKLNGEIRRALWAIPYPGGPNDAVPVRRQSDEGFATWEAVRIRESRRVHAGATPVERNDQGPAIPGRGDSQIHTPRTPQTPEAVRDRLRARYRSPNPSRSRLRGEGETWGSRTEEEGSLIIACCDQTVKFFEVWAGKSKGRGLGLGSKEGVLGGSRVLEGWCEGVEGVELGGEAVIR